MSNNIIFAPTPTKFHMYRYVETGEINDTSDDLIKGLRLDLRDSEIATPSFLSVFKSLVRSNGSDRYKIQSLIETRYAIEYDLRAELKIQRDAHVLCTGQELSQVGISYCGAMWNHESLSELRDVADALVQYSLTVIANIESHLRSICAVCGIDYETTTSDFDETVHPDTRLYHLVPLLSQSSTPNRDQRRKEQKKAKKKTFLNF
jgi:hypothetical protein